MRLDERDRPSTRAHLWTHRLTRPRSPIGLCKPASCRTVQTRCVTIAGCRDPAANSLGAPQVGQRDHVYVRPLDLGQRRQQPVGLHPFLTKGYSNVCPAKYCCPTVESMNFRNFSAFSRFLAVPAMPAPATMTKLSGPPARG